MLRHTKQQNQFFFYTGIFGNNWKRLLYIRKDDVRDGDHQSPSIGLSFLLYVTAHSTNTVLNHTFLITTGHTYYGEITQLAGTTFSQFTLRIVCSNYGNVYIDILDNLTWHAMHMPGMEMPINIVVTKLSNCDIHVIDQYITEDNIPSETIAVETLTTKGANMIVSKITEKKT